MDYFIETVKKHEVLWRTDHADYKAGTVKEESWKNVIKECNLLNVKEAKALWKKLRDGHRQAVNKKTVTGQRITNERQWKYVKKMEFLLPYMGSRPKSITAIDPNDPCDTNYPPLPTKTEFVALEDEIQDQDMIFESEDSESLADLKRAKSDASETKPDRELQFLKMQREMDERLATERESFKIELMQKRCTLESFFSSMCDMTLELPEHLQMRIQRKLFDSIMEAKEETLKI